MCSEPVKYAYSNGFLSFIFPDEEYELTDKGIVVIVGKERRVIQYKKISEAVFRSFTIRWPRGGPLYHAITIKEGNRSTELKFRKSSVYYSSEFFNQIKARIGERAKDRRGYGEQASAIKIAVYCVATILGIAAALMGIALVLGLGFGLMNAGWAGLFYGLPFALVLLLPFIVAILVIGFDIFRKPSPDR